MPGAFRPMSFSLSTCHHGLKTAPDGDFFSSLMNLSTDHATDLLSALNRDNRFLNSGEIGIVH